jgi:hypothetical protein
MGIVSDKLHQLISVGLSFLVPDEFPFIIQLSFLGNDRNLILLPPLLFDSHQPFKKLGLIPALLASAWANRYGGGYVSTRSPNSRWKIRRHTTPRVEFGFESDSFWNDATRAGSEQIYLARERSQHR